MTDVRRFRKKPVVIEAIHWTGDNVEAVMQFIDVGDDPPCTEYLFRDRAFKISTLEGDMEARVGDWIIRGVAGEVYPCKPEIFEATYEPAEDA